MASGNVTVPELAAALIATFEGLRLQSYDDATGKPVLDGQVAKGTLTIGYGHTGADVTPGLTISRDLAEALFLKDQAPLLKLVEGRPLLEAACLVSFGFNCGAGALGRVMAGHALMDQFTHANNKENPGLVARRKLEELLILVSQQNFKA